MAKVHPKSLLPNSSSSTVAPTASAREVFTVWMKSLVLNGNGCAVYDCDGRLVYRVDNYDCKCSDEVYFMDHIGNTLFKILRKKIRVFGRWEGYRCNDSTGEGRQPWFRVRRDHRWILNRDHRRKTTVTVGCGEDDETCYEINGVRPKSYYRISDMAGCLAAEVKRKQTATGVGLGDDVLMLTVEPDVDRLLILGLVVVCGLIDHSM